MKAKKDKYLDFAREQKITMKHEDDNNINYNWCTLNNPQRLGKGTGGLGNQRTSGDHSRQQYY